MNDTRPEREMVRRALLPAAIAVPVAFGLGAVAGGSAAGWSAALGITIAFANFAAHGLSLAWASGVSIGAVHAVALGGVLVRLGVVVALLFVLNTTGWFSPLAFGLAVLPGTIALLAYEAKLMLGGMRMGLQIPPDPTAAAAHDRLVSRRA